MSKKSSKSLPVGRDDLNAFVAQDSSFAFEMSVLSELIRLRFKCDHSGTYEDPITNKVRQFDIRATLERGDKGGRLGCLVLAVECKMLNPGFPLLVSLSPRTRPEAFVDVVVKGYAGMEVVEFTRTQAYMPREPVGRKIDQVGKREDGSLFSDDEETFQKVQQAINSSASLVQNALTGGTRDALSVVLPVLVVPQGTLWTVRYEADGAVVGSPEPCDRASVILAHRWRVETPLRPAPSYRLSHLEILTAGHIGQIIDCFFDGDSFLGSA
jgi:hypothetical protein